MTSGCVKVMAAIATAASLASCTSLAPQQPDGAAVARGEAVAAQWCATCHAVGSSASATNGAPAFTEIANRPGHDLVALRAFLDGDHFPMTTYRLFPAERDDVATYIGSLRRR